MAGNLGNLTVGLGLDAAEFSKGLSKSQFEAQKTLDGIADAAKKIGLAIGAAVSVDVFKELVTGAIEAADHLNDLSKKTGIAVETLGGIGFAAQQAGGNLESAVAGTTKLNKSLADAAAGGKETSEAFKLLGISAKDSAGATLSADQAMVRIADAFAGAEDGPEKVAIAIKLFGKAGADMIPLLDEGGAKLRENIAYFERYSGVTKETAEAADQFNDTLAKVNLINKSFGQLLAAELLPLLQDLANLYLESKQNSDLFATAAAGIRVALEALVVVGANVFFVLSQVGQAIGAVAAGSVALATGDFSGVKTIFNAYNDQAAEARKNLDDFEKRVLKVKDTTKDASDFAKLDFVEAPKKKLGSLTPAATGPTDDPSKKLLDNQLKLIQNGIDRERDLLGSRNKFLDLFNQQNLLSIKDYYGGRKVAQDEATKAEIAGYDQQIAALQAYQNASGRLEKDKADAQVKITEIVGKRAKAELQAGETGIEMAVREAKAQEDLRKAFAAVGAQVDDLQERFGKAAGTKFDLQFDALKKTFTAEGNQAGLDAIAVLRQAAVAQGDFQKASTDAGRLTEGLARQEEYLALAQQTGSISTIEQLKRVGDARRAQIPLLEAQVAAEEAIAKASGSDSLIANAQAARLALEKLKASADPLGDKLREAFQGPATDGLYALISGTKSAKDAFKDFANSVLQDIQRMAAKNLSESLLGGSSGGGFLGALAGLFGGGSGNVNTSGSYQNGSDMGFSLASGTDYVPYDNFKANLHKGERVVPAAFNPANSGGTSSGGGNTYVTVEDHAGGKVTESREQKGQDEFVRIIIESAVDKAASEVAAGGRMHKAIAGTYGLSRAAGAPRRS